MVPRRTLLRLTVHVDQSLLEQLAPNRAGWRQAIRDALAAAVEARRKPHRGSSKRAGG